ncbi:MAG: Coenzyme F420 hydrogenase/dehydrogenase, beta subunit C-terminal domain [Planctomycetota bacterium]
MSPSIRSIRDVAERQLCNGCGACAYAAPGAVTMVDDLEQGRRPLVREGADTTGALAVCPGVGLDAPPLPAGAVPELVRGWGAVLDVFEGYATDEDIRFHASSGGAATALATFGLASGGMSGVLHIRAREDVPYLNETCLSTTPAEVRRAVGSRYAPASPCDGLAAVEAAPGPCVFIGKPCDVAATHKARATRPALDAKLGVTIAIFCAGAPATRGTLEMLKRMGFDDPGAIEGLRYRGHGWPGRAAARLKSGAGGEASLTYQESWGEVLQRFVPWRCRICPDHTGEFADLSVGDPWYHDEIPANEAGRSLVIVRTERGRRFLEAAVAAGALTLERRDPSALPRSQPNLLRVRGAVFGRVLVSRLFGAAAPRYRGFGVASVWLRDLSLKERAQAFYGTVKRVFAKGLLKRLPVQPFTPPSPRPAASPAPSASERQELRA